MLPTSDTAAIDLFLTDKLPNRDLRQFQMRLLRDAAFLEKVFLKKLSLAELNSDIADLFSIEDFKELLQQKIKPAAKNKKKK